MLLPLQADPATFVIASSVVLYISRFGVSLKRVAKLSVAERGSQLFQADAHVSSCTRKIRAPDCLCCIAFSLLVPKLPCFHSGLPKPPITK